MAAPTIIVIFGPISVTMGGAIQLAKEKTLYIILKLKKKKKKKKRNNVRMLLFIGYFTIIL